MSLPEEGRRRVVELARRHEVLVVEDDPYGLLRFEGEPAPTLHELDGGDNVVYSCVVHQDGGARHPHRLPGAARADGGGDGAAVGEHLIAPNTFAEAALAAYCRAGRFEPNVERATATLKQRRDAMEAALREHFPAGARWTTPEGGYFYWVDLPEQIDTAELLPQAAERGVPYISGKEFCAGGGARRCGWPSAPLRPSRSARALPGWARCFSEALTPARRQTVRRRPAATRGPADPDGRPAARGAARPGAPVEAPPSRL